MGTRFRHSWVGMLYPIIVVIWYIGRSDRDDASASVLPGSHKRLRSDSMAPRQAYLYLASAPEQLA
jgi:hypothetical protein